MAERAREVEPRREKRRRLFFALWPSAVQQQALATAMHARVKEVNGRAIPARNLHVTLAFLGSVPEARVELAAACAGKVRGSAFDLELDQIEIWARAHVLCLTPSRIPAQLLELAEQLRLSLLSERFEIRQEEYRPHVTLARDVRRRNARTPIAPVCWQVQEFVLVESRPGPAGSEYEVLERWALSARRALGA